MVPLMYFLVLGQSHLTIQHPLLSPWMFCQTRNILNCMYGNTEHQTIRLKVRVTGKGQGLQLGLQLAIFLVFRGVLIFWVLALAILKAYFGMEGSSCSEHATNGQKVLIPAARYTIKTTINEHAANGKKLFTVASRYMVKILPFVSAWQ